MKLAAPTPVGPAAANRTPVADLVLTSMTGTERVSVALGDRRIRLGSLSVADAARAAQDVMGFPSGSWAVVREADGTRIIAPLVSSDDGCRSPNVDADMFSTVAVESRSSSLEAVVGYRMVLDALAER